MTKQELVRSIVGLLVAYAKPNVWWTTFPEDRRQLPGRQKGLPDILVLVDGRAHWIICCPPGSRTAPGQMPCATSLRAVGMQCARAADLPFVRSALIDWGAIYPTNGQNYQRQPDANQNAVA